MLDLEGRKRAAVAASPAVAAARTRVGQTGVDAQAAGALARFGAQVAGTLHDVSVRQMEARREQDLTDALSSSTQALADFRLELDKDPDHAGWVEKYDGFAFDLRRENAERLGGQAGVDYARRLDSMVLSQRIALKQKAATRERQAQVVALDSGNQVLLGDALAAETDTHQQAALAQINDNLNRAVNTGVLTPAAARQQSQRILATFETQQTVDLIEARPAAALELLRDPDRLLNIPPARRAGMERTAVRALEAQEKAAQAVIRQQAERAYQVWRNGDVPQGWSEIVGRIEGFDPDTAAEMRRDGQAFSEVIAGGFATLAPNAQAARLDQIFGTGPLTPEQSHRKEIYERAHRATAEAFARDPVTWLYRTDPTLRDLYSRLAEAEQALVAGAGDEGPWRSAQAVAYDAFLDAQESAGVPRHERRVLPQAQAARIAASLAAASPAETVVRAQGLAQRYGEYWPRVYRELAGEANGALKGHHKVLAGMTRHGQQASAMLLAEAMQTGRKGLEDVLDRDQVIDLRDELTDAMEDLREELALLPGGQQGYLELHGAARLLSLKHMAMGLDADEAAEKAVGALYGDHYRQAGAGDDRYRVPMDRLASIAQDPDDAAGLIEEGAERQRGAALDAAFAAGAIDVTRIRPQSVDQSQAEVAEQYRIVLQESGRWVTTEDESGLVLVDPLGQPVRRRDGTRWEFDFRELAVEQMPPEDLDRATRNAVRNSVADPGGPGTPQEAAFDDALGAAHTTVRTMFPQVALYPDGPRIALVKLAYDIGPEAMAAAPGLVEAVQAGDWNAAAMAIVQIPGRFLADTAAIEAAEFMILGERGLHREPPFETEWQIGGGEELKGGSAGDAFLAEADALSKRVRDAIAGRTPRRDRAPLSPDELRELTEVFVKVTGMNRPRPVTVRDRRRR